jgi:hypothetical protein
MFKKQVKLLCLVTLVSLILMTTACSNRKNLSPLPTISDEAKSEMAAPVDCKTARGDIAVLEEERASVAKQILSGVRSLMPISAAAGILMGDYRDRASVATGKYNHDIELKIDQIKAKCGIR